MKYLITHGTPHEDDYEMLHDRLISCEPMIFLERTAVNVSKSIDDILEKTVSYISNPLGILYKTVVSYISTPIGHPGKGHPE